ncbi:MAG TPA: NADH-quinone oxidoreductase subunit NuoK [Thermoanaerobaculaceae bacterium]|jgi:NADH-quinone oxidoreductase subunit K|nr:MAG: NADH-quinone oxidoreductase subunit K [Acidobacteria bacterium 37-71-11]HQT95010.1 NADH-quinone oxidoreductase subunit NuoK [Thermoanaerobaculaceae bacterium]HQU33625.1 NADH-quinone oxidoreductase subunit NuoK [Thermoanaerobaculaceae bacterium]
MISTTHVLVLSLALFTLGVVGMAVRRNFITVLMCVELILNAANLNFIAFSRQLGDLTGQVFAVFVITIAAAEAAIGLGIIVALVRLKQTVNLDQVNVMEG